VVLAAPTHGITISRSTARDWAPRAALGAIAVAFAFLSFAVAVLTPAWEAPDEPYHVLNVETLVRGHWYRIQGDAGLEPHQPPLYYLGLAGWQKSFRTPARRPHPVGISLRKFVTDNPCSYDVCTTYRHDVPQESAEKRLVLLLRIPSILCGIGVLLFTAAAARRLSRDRWTPVVAAALVASVPRFVFLSGSVNNDNLSNVLAAALLFIAVAFLTRSPQTFREGWSLALALGVLSGSLLLTKVSAAALVFAVVVAIVLGTERARPRVELLALAGGSALVVSSFWLVQNQRWYGDPLAITRSREYLTPILGLGYPRHYGAARILLVDAPRLLYRNFWYDSTLGHLPLWLLLIVAVGGLAIPSARTAPRNTPQLILLAAFVASALFAFGAVIMQSATARASIAYIGLPALCCLAALGLERLRIPLALRFVGPLVGVSVTALGIAGIIEEFHS
jgi:4-amino-4-deoxy-L-arabinose transferase-like glycosyltransferase